MKLPAIWDLPQEIRHRVSKHQGRQRAMEAEGHILFILYRVPQPRTNERHVVYLWRKPDGTWEFSERGTGINALSGLLQEYEQVVEEMESRQESAKLPEHWYAIVERIGPVQRAIQQMYVTLQEARRTIPDLEQQAALQGPCDQASNLVRGCDQLLADAKISMDFFATKQSYIQSLVSRDQARAAFRLNILAALFLPLGTIAAVFGMNLQHGLEAQSSWFFWGIFAAGITAGVAIGAYVLNFNPKSLELDDLVTIEDTGPA